MFAWLKKRQLNEHRKLVYQNLSACSSIRAYFDMAGSKDIAQELENIEHEIQRIAQSGVDGHLFGPEDAKRLLEINKFLRRTYELTATSRLESFDESHVPPGGWNRYFARLDEAD